MSDKIVVNELLAFLQQRLDVMDEVSIAQICRTSFHEDEIRKTKTLLFELLGKSDRMPTRRRDEKGERSLQDIISLLKETDPDDVPTFVAKDLHRVPPVTFDHVDVTRLLKDITSLKTSLADLTLKFEASLYTIAELRNEVNDLRADVPPLPSHKIPASTKSTSPMHTSADKTTCDASPRPAPPVTLEPKNVTASSPRCDYAEAAKKLPKQKQRQVQSKLETVQPRKSVPSRPSEKTDKDGFTKVERKPKKSVTRNQCGTGAIGANHLLRPAVPTTLLYVSRLHYTTKEENLVQYILMKTKFTVRVQPLESRHNVNFKSFVVRVPTDNLAVFIKEDFWPRGVMYRKFRGRLRDTSSQLSTPTLRAQ